MDTVYLVGVDGSNCSDRAIAYAVERARENGGRVLVAFVIEWSPYSFSTPEENAERHMRREQELERAHEQVIDPLVARLSEQGIETEGLVAHGHVAQTLDRLARERDVTCLVIGRKGSSRLAQFFGSVASRLVQIVDRPVTVVP
ncbi:MAG: universal stress protein [Pseudomonadota bacterium]